MTIGTRIYTMLFGEFVGRDELGNSYYRKSATGGKEKRWVLFAGESEPSKIPPLWHGWIHYISNEIPPEKVKRRKWEKPHRPNLSGTHLAYVPPGHAAAGGDRRRAESDYEAWKP